jgi:hypothetical protein
MKNIALLLSCAVSFAICMPVFGQCLWRENTLMYSKEDENVKNFLGVISYKDADFTDLVFVKKKPGDQIVYETIRLDEELFVVDKFEEAEKDFATDYFKGPHYKTTVQRAGLYDYARMTILQSVEEEYKWNWKSGSYDLVRQVETKKLVWHAVFPGSGKKQPFYHMADYYDEDTQELTLIGKITGSKTEKTNPKHSVYILKYNKELELISTKTIEFDYSYSVEFSAIDNLDGDKIVLVLAPKLPSRFVKISNPEPFKYKLFVIDPDGKIVKQHDFQTPCLRWSIHGVTFLENEIAVYGMGDKLLDGALSAASGNAAVLQKESEQTFKPNYMVVGRLKEDGSSFSTTVTPTESIKHIAKATDNNIIEPLIFNGKLGFQELKIGANGQIYLTGMAFLPNIQPITYSSYFFLSIDPDGKLSNFYCMRNPQMGSGITTGGAKHYPGESYVYESPDDPNTLLWVVRFVNRVNYRATNYKSLGIALLMSNVSISHRPTSLYKPVMFEIDARSGDFKECKDRLEKDFHLYGSFLNQSGEYLPHVKLKKPGEWLLVGKNKENSIWVGKLVR